MPHIEGGPHPDVLLEVERQGYMPRLVLTTKADEFSYSDALRRWWREGTGFIIIEHRAMPPPGAISEYLECPYPLCSRPHNCRRDGVMGSLACIKFSTELVQSYPDLADRSLARRVHDLWWRWGFLQNRPYTPGTTAPRDIRSACIRPEVVERYGPWPGPSWPTTQAYSASSVDHLTYDVERRPWPSTIPWPHGDFALGGALERRCIGTHYHDTPSQCIPDPDEHFPSAAADVVQ